MALARPCGLFLLPILCSSASKSNTSFKADPLLPFLSVTYHRDTPYGGGCSGSNSGRRLTVVAAARTNTRKESAKVRNRRLQKKYNGSATKPRISVFCSTKQLYAMLIDDQSKKTLFYANTLQKSIREDPPCSSIVAAQRVGEELVKVCMELNITEISSYDRNGFARGEKMEAFEIAIAKYGFLPR